LKAGKDMKYRRIVFGLFPGVFFLMFTSSLLWAGEPGDVVKKVISKDISLKDEVGTKERKHEIWKEISPSFDFEEMAKRAMGRYWGERSSEEKREFIELFAKNIQGSYMRTHGPRFGEKEIISLDEEQNNGYARVQVDLVKRTEETVTAKFCLVRKNGEWRICDVIFEGVSLLRNYRSQIYSFMSKSSYEELIQTFKQIQAKE
jgi:phospholipid transport system substrate-binding protein